MATIDLELVQNYDTDFLLYDGTNRTLCPGDALPIADITRVTVVFKGTSDFLTEDKTFIIDGKENAIVIKVNYNDNKHFPDVLETQRKQMQRNDPELYLHIWEGELKKNI